MCQGASSSSPRSKRRLFIASSTLSGGGDSSPSGSWPPVTWKGSGAHVPPSVQVARAPTRTPARGYSRLRFRPACGPGWPADVAIFPNSAIFFYFFSCCSKLNKMQTHVLNRPTA
ncbi:unnamed protein product [Spirodela intermedia]|uniref:Uncharacterized protein n=1 Tax=Spirodela intermedia TaxID=51605 RepID=A0A7I8LCL5_SPIIN|nr:unnamed protein product [Spirodela intermedia]